MAKTTTKRAMLGSAISLLLCFAMLLGTTFAWFTDNVTSTGNRIISGDLEIDLLMDKTGNGTYTTIAGGSGDIFSEAGDGKWEPGKTQIVYLAVENKGSLALKYNIILDIKDGGLAKALEYAVIDGAKAADIKAANATKWADIKAAATTKGDVVAGKTVAAPNGKLDEIALNNTQNERDYFALAVHMKKEAGNEYEDKNITIDVLVNATQVEAEEDSFGPEYDKDAEFEKFVASSDEFDEAVENGGNYTLNSDAKLTSAISEDLGLNLNNNTLTLANSYKLSNGADLTVTNGTVYTNATFGFVDVRPGSATEPSVVKYEGVKFVNEKKNNTYGPSTNRLESVIEFCAENDGAKAEFYFKDCTFENAKVFFEGMSGKTGEFTATFENCTFNALTSSAPIEAQNYVTGTINVIGCTFNLEVTSSSASAIAISPSTSTKITLNATNNTINAKVATPTDSSVTGVDVIKVNGTPNNIKLISAYENSTVTESGTKVSGIAVLN